MELTINWVWTIYYEFLHNLSMTLGGRAIQVLNRPFWLILNGYYVIFNSNTYQNLGTYNVFNSLTHIEVTFSPKKPTVPNELISRLPVKWMMNMVARLVVQCHIMGFTSPLPSFEYRSREKVTHAKSKSSTQHKWTQLTFSIHHSASGLEPEQVRTISSQVRCLGVSKVIDKVTTYHCFRDTQACLLLAETICLLLRCQCLFLLKYCRYLTI